MGGDAAKEAEARRKAEAAGDPEHSRCDHLGGDCRYWPRESEAAPRGDDPDDEDAEVIRCWCGAEGTYNELFNDDYLGTSCGGTGHVDCYCGGDLCVCHHHGQEVECPGCEDCELDDDDWDDDWDDDEP